MSTDAQTSREALIRSSSNLKQILFFSIPLVLAPNLAFLILEIVTAQRTGEGNTDRKVAFKKKKEKATIC